MGQPLGDRHVADNVRQRYAAGLRQRTDMPPARSSADGSTLEQYSFAAPLDDTNTAWPWRPCEVTMHDPSISRIYDDYMGGGQNFGVDRVFAQQVRAVLPDVQRLARAARRFLDRALRHCLLQGIDQVIDIGAGIASQWSSHHIVHVQHPAARLLYVDNEAVAVASLHEATRDDPRVGVVRADVREPEIILEAGQAIGLIDLSQPVAIVMGLLLHFIPDSDNPAGLLAQYRHEVSSGSYLILSHDTADGRETDMRRVSDLYAQTNRPLILRSHVELTTLLDGYQLVPPGLTYMPLWRPDPADPAIREPERSCVYAAMGRT